MMENPNFLKNKYNLHNAPEVEAAAKRMEKREGEKVPQNPQARIENYLDRFKQIIDRKDSHERERGMEALKKVLFDKFVTEFDEVPESYLKKQLREKGMSGDYEQVNEEQKKIFKKENIEPALRDQQASLEQWIDYFFSTDSSYIPDYLKYWVLREVTGLQEYDKEKKKFPDRSLGTVNKFPDLNYEALGYIIDAVMKKYQGNAIEFEHDIQPEERQRFQQYLQGENFAKLYAWSIELVNPIPEHLLHITEGEWKKYTQGSSHRPLVESIRGKGTGWCTAGENTAKTQLNGGDFHVFYSLDDDKKPTIPRLAIRMDGDKIGEIRGVAYKQNLDPYMSGVLEEKLNEKGKFPDKEHYLKKDHDMKFLTGIERKTKSGQSLSKDELIFLYEIDSQIEGFGYQRDPRIKELRDQRNPKEDAPIVFGCASEEIAWKQENINEKTKAYVGPLFKDIFQMNIENIFTSFPEGRIEKAEMEVGGKSTEELEREIKNKKDDQSRNYQINSYAASMMKNPDFITAKNSEKIDLVRLKVGDLGFTKNPTTDELYAKAEELGLELCPAEVGPHLRLKYEEVFKREQPMNEYLRVGMKQIAGSDGNLYVFSVERDGDGFWLDYNWANPGYTWILGREFVFRLRKPLKP